MFKYYKMLNCLQLKITGLIYHYTCQLHILMMFESFSFTEKIVKFPGFVLLSLSLTSEHFVGSNECNLTSAQLDKHTNRLYVVVRFLICILKAHDYSHVQEQLSSELVSVFFQCHSVVLVSNSHSIPEHHTPR